MISLKWMQFSSIDFTSNYFVHNKVENKLKFHNHILKNEINLFNHYAREFIKALKMIDNFKFENIKLEIEKIKNADVLESNANIELVVQVMKKYGYGPRYIIKEIFGGENLKQYEYFSKKENIETIKIANLMDLRTRVLIKVPLKKKPIIKKEDNKIRLVVLIMKIQKEKIVYPLFLDIHHYLYSLSNYEKVPQEKIFFEKEFLKRVFKYL